MPKNECFGFLLSVCFGHALADLPLTVEDLIADKGKVKLDFSVVYANADRQGISTGEPITIQTGPTSFVILPALIGESTGNSDTTVATLGLRLRPHRQSRALRTHERPVFKPAHQRRGWCLQQQRVGVCRCLGGCEHPAEKRR